MAGTHGKSARPRKVRARPAVDDEQRRHLIEACAFFRAERFRECEPGHVREQDVRAAASEIDAVIRPGRKRGKR
jgi:hypothetical protein